MSFVTYHTTEVQVHYRYLVPVRVLYLVPGTGTGTILLPGCVSRPLPVSYSIITGTGTITRYEYCCYLVLPLVLYTCYCTSECGTSIRRIPSYVLSPPPPSRRPKRRDQSTHATTRWLLSPYPRNNRASGSLIWSIAVHTTIPGYSIIIHDG